MNSVSSPRTFGKRAFLPVLLGLLDPVLWLELHLSMQVRSMARGPGTVDPSVTNKHENAGEREHGIAAHWIAQHLRNQFHSDEIAADSLPEREHRQTDQKMDNAAEM